MQFNQRGVQVTVDDEEVRRIVQERLNSEQPPRSAPIVPLFFSAMPRIGAHWGAMGGIYAGVCAGRDGGPDYHLILGPEHPSELPWQEGNDWAPALEVHGFKDFTLPYRAEQAILFGNLRSHFRETCYWSREQHAGFSSYAWGQFFHNGYQYYWLKDVKLRCRAVRRFSI